MKKFIIENVEFEITDEKAAKLLESGALIEGEDRLELDIYHLFFYEEVLILLFASD